MWLIMNWLDLLDNCSFFSYKISNISQVHLRNYLLINAFRKLVKNLQILPHLKSSINLFLKVIKLSNINLAQFQNTQILQTFCLSKLQVIILGLNVKKFSNHIFRWWFQWLEFFRFYVLACFLYLFQQVWHVITCYFTSVMLSFSLNILLDIN